MRSTDWAAATPDAVLDFWFPRDGHEAEFASHRGFWTWRMRGGADAAIRERFTELTDAAARGLLDHWADTPRGRLALVVALDQFSRSVWRNEPAAFSQDIKATRLVLEALRNGQYQALPSAWEKTFCIIAMGHCEGPDHLERMDRGVALALAVLEAAPEHLRLSYRVALDQARLARDVIARFARYPHRNPVLGRISTPAEEAYIAAGEFPHARDIPGTEAGIEQMLAGREPSADESAPRQA